MGRTAVGQCLVAVSGRSEKPVRIKRPAYLFFNLEDRSFVDIAKFLRGELKTFATISLQAFLGSTGTAQPITLDELRILAEAPADRWIDAGELISRLGLEPTAIDDLTARGLLLSDAGDPQRTFFRRQDERLAANQWHPIAALQFFAAADSSRYLDPALVQDLLPEESRERFAAFIAKHGLPPPAFYALESSEARYSLPAGDGDGELYDLLLARRTCRRFEQSAALPLAPVATLLRYAFGCHGTSELADGLTVLKRTSPSGGSMHPIEIFPLLLHVDSLPTGVYHYNAEHHALDLLRRLEPDEARRTAAALAGGQSYVGTAHAVFLLVARFLRNQWKYRRIARTHNVILMDAAHLSQTFYLLAAKLELGAFFSAAIDVAKAEELLSFNSAEMGAVGMCGCGIPRFDEAGATLERRPFVPRSGG
ncbi:MAG: putative peptide maturation dehydrogenase [Acidobacteria bacterium]|nr:MAG: putative peptide maturation dehydrogenase [Acidobacteriota bacterium]